MLNTVPAGSGMPSVGTWAVFPLRSLGSLRKMVSLRYHVFWMSAGVVAMQGITALLFSHGLSFSKEMRSSILFFWCNGQRRGGPGIGRSMLNAPIWEGFQGRLYSHSIIVSNNIVKSESSCAGWAFIPQEGNTILSTINAFLIRTRPEESEKLFNGICRDMILKFI